MQTENVLINAAEERRFDLDWVRVGAFALLILYHVGLYYSSGNWVVNSAHESRVVDVLLLGTHPWRMSLLFLISGAATAYIAAKMEPLQLLASRSARLLVPFFFGIFVIVPPQIYCATQEFFGNDEGYLSFWFGRYLTSEGSIVHDGQFYALRSAAHLWFVGYLWIYTTVFLFFARHAGFLSAARRFGQRHLSGPGLFAWPMLFFIATRQVMFPIFGEMTGLCQDWYNHVDFFAAFGFGLIFARPCPLWVECARLRRPALTIALAAWAGHALLFWIHGPDLGASDLPSLLMRIVHPIERWSAIVAVLGFGRAHLNRDSALLRYLTGAIFTYYIVHQTILVVVAHTLARQNLPFALEAVILVGSTAVLCALAYEAIRRIPVLRFFFGMRVRRVQPETAIRNPAPDVGARPLQVPVGTG